MGKTYFFTYPQYGEGGKLTSEAVPYAKGSQNQKVVTINDLKKAGFTRFAELEANGYINRIGYDVANKLRAMSAI